MFAWSPDSVLKSFTGSAMRLCVSRDFPLRRSVAHALTSSFLTPGARRQPLATVGAVCCCVTEHHTRVEDRSSAGPSPPVPEARGSEWAQQGWVSRAEAGGRLGCVLSGALGPLATEWSLADLGAQWVCDRGPHAFRAKGQACSDDQRPVTSLHVTPSRSPDMAAQFCSWPRTPPPALPCQDLT